MTFATSEATIYNWLRQERIDRGEIPGASTDMALELAAARRRIRELESLPPASEVLPEPAARSRGFSGPVYDRLSPWQGLGEYSVADAGGEGRPG